MYIILIRLHHSQGIPSMSSSIGLIGTPSRSSSGAPSMGAPSMGPASIGTPSISSRRAQSTYSPIGAPSMSSAGSGWTKHSRHKFKASIGHQVEREVITKSVMVMYQYNTHLWYDSNRLLFYCKINKTQEDVLQLDEEGVRIYSPVLPCTEAWHHTLLHEGDERQMSEWHTAGGRRDSVSSMWTEGLVP